MSSSVRAYSLLLVGCLGTALGACSEAPDAGPAPPPGAPANASPQIGQDAPAHPVTEPQPDAGDEERARLAAMRTRFADLQALHDATRTRFNDLAYAVGRTELDAERAREIARLFDQAGYRLRMPKGLGAFSDVEGIEREIEALRDVQGMLDRVETLLAAAARPPGNS